MLEIQTEFMLSSRTDAQYILYLYQLS